jgi:hypothetical protein
MYCALYILKWYKFCDAVCYVMFMLWKLYVLELLGFAQLRFVTLRHVTFTLCFITLCSNIMDGLLSLLGDGDKGTEIVYGEETKIVLGRL